MIKTNKQKKNLQNNISSLKLSSLTKSIIYFYYYIEFMTEQCLKYNKIYFETSKLIVKLKNTNDLKWQYKIIAYQKFAAVLK